MSLKGQFKQKLYKEDLVPVIKQGIFVAFVGGLLIGAVNLLVLYLGGISVIWMLCIIMAFYLAKRVRNAYMQYHIWYPTISVIAFVLGFYLLNVVSHAGYLFVLNYVDMNVYLLTLNPIPYFSFLWPLTWFGSGSSLFNGIINFLFFGIAGYYAFKYSMKR